MPPEQVARRIDSIPWPVSPWNPRRSEVRGAARAAEPVDGALQVLPADLAQLRSAIAEAAGPEAADEALFRLGRRLGRAAVNPAASGGESAERALRRGLGELEGRGLGGVSIHSVHVEPGADCLVVGRTLGDTGGAGVARRERGPVRADGRLHHRDDRGPDRAGRRLQPVPLPRPLRGPQLHVRDPSRASRDGRGPRGAPAVRKRPLLPRLHGAGGWATRTSRCPRCSSTRRTRSS